MGQNPQIDVIKQRAEAIAKRRSDITQEMAALNTEASELAKEYDELMVAARVIARLLNEPDKVLAEPVTGSPPERQGKPPGIPTVFDMADKILEESEAAGANWIEGQDIVAKIRAKWWPHARTVDVIPTLWRLAQQDRLRKDGTKYARVNTAAALSQLRMAMK